MSNDDRQGNSARHGGLMQLAVLWLGLIAACDQLAGCASPASKPAFDSAQPAARESDLEQRLRDLQQAEALYLSGRFKEAQAAFEQLARTYPNNPEVWFRLGNTRNRSKPLCPRHPGAPTGRCDRPAPEVDSFRSRSRRFVPLNSRIRCRSSR
jgi:hypothetical protein